ncbi:MAG TPA: hypothetical protein VFT22_44220 [Kofleriaceae bacterium]|nr:hypothetical protein [Kofleriaceae bacterium]
MEALKAFLDSLKAATYELTALLLPGAAALFSALSILGTTPPGGVIGVIGGSYALGLALQGIAAFVFGSTPFRYVISESANLSTTRSYALGLAKKKLGEGVPDAAMFDICLTTIHTHRYIYDKFVALRDTVRALAIALIFVSGCVIYGSWDTLTAGSWLCVTAKLGGAILISVVVLGGFIERHARFHSLAQQVVYGQFIAVQMAVMTENRQDTTKEPEAGRA